MLVTFGPLVQSLSGKLGPIAFYRSTGANIIRTTHRYAVLPSALQSQRRQAFSRCSRLWPDPNYDIDAAVRGHAILAGDPVWNHILSANLNNEIDASGWLPIPWDGTLDPLTGVTAEYGIATGFVRLRWAASPNEAGNNIGIGTRKLKTAPDHFHGAWVPTVVTFQWRDSHQVQIYGLDPDVLYQFSLSPYQGAPYPHAKSVNITAYPKP